jgi:hypothetical protein
MAQTDLLGAGLAAIVGNLQVAHGDTTLVNGIAVSGAMWAEAQAGRVQMFLSEDLVGKPAYDVTFPASVTGAPWNLKGGSSVVRSAYGWRGSVQMIEENGVSDVGAVVRALVFLAVGK